MGVISDIGNLGSGAWDVVSGREPAAAIYTTTCSAMPKVDDWQSVSAATGTNHLMRQLYIENRRNDEAIHIVWKLNWEYGARYRGGGAFIPNCWISVDYCNVIPGWGAAISVEVRNTENAGTDTAPVARLLLTVHSRFYSWAENESKDYNFALLGSGEYQLV
jgi:hypothetical protein